MKSVTIATALLLAEFGHSAPLCPSLILPRASGSSYTSGATANDVTDGVCAPLTFIFARGSTETGNIGTIGVEYPASIEGDADLGADGGPAMKKLAEQALSQCPDTKIALSGYSQGSMVVHNTILSQGLSAHNVAAVVLFGDPLLGQPVGSVPSFKLKEYCATGDAICETHSFTITAAHLSYGSDTAEAAAWIISTTGASSSSSSDNSTSTETTPSSKTSSGSSSVSAAAGSSASGSLAPSGLSPNLGGFGGLSGLGSGSLPVGLSLPTGLGSLGGSSANSELGSLGSLGSLMGSSGSLPTDLSSLGGSAGLGSLGSGSSGLGSLGGLGGIKQ